MRTILPLRRTLAPRRRDPVAIPHRLRHRRAVDGVRHHRGGDDVGAIVVRPEALQADRLDARACRPGQDRVALEHLRQALLEDQAERDVERAPERDRRGEGAVGRVLSLAVRRPRPVEVVAAPGLLGGQLQRPRVGRGEPKAGRAHQRLLRARHDHVHPPLVLRQVDRAQARDRVDGDDRAVVVGDLGQRPHVVDDAGRGLGLGREHGLRRLRHAGERRLEPLRSDRLAPFDVQVGHLAAVGLAQLEPALAELARGGDRDAVAGRDQVGDRRLHRAGPRGGEGEDLVGGLEDVPQPLERRRVHLDERRGAVVGDRLGHHLAHGRRQRRRPGGHQVLLDVGIGRHRRQG